MGQIMKSVPLQALVSQFIKGFFLIFAIVQSLEFKVPTLIAVEQEVKI